MYLIHPHLLSGTSEETRQIDEMNIIIITHKRQQQEQNKSKRRSGGNFLYPTKEKCALDEQEEPIRRKYESKNLSN